MFGRGKKSSGPSKSDQVRKPAATDMFGMPDLSAYAVKEEFDVSNEALEAELAALLEEEDDAPKITRQRRPAPAQPPKSADPMRQIDAMAAEALKDTDDDPDDDDDDEDEDLLAELDDITQESSETLTPPSTQQKKAPSPIPSPKMTNRPTPQPSPASQSAPTPGLRPGPSNVNRSPSPARKPGPGPGPVAPSPTQSEKPSEPVDINTVLQQRAQSYQQAVAAAEAAGESTKVRRYKRQLKMLQDMLRKVKLGKPINKDEIPPEVYVPKPAAVEQPPPQEKQPVPEAAPVSAVTQPTSPPAVQQEQPDAAESKSADAEQLKLMSVRRDQYKMAALLAKRSGDMKTAAEHLKIAKQFDVVIKALEAGQQVDLSEMPGPPSQPAPAAPRQQAPAPQPSRAPAPTAPGPSTASGPGPSTAPGPGPSVSSEEEQPRPKTDLEAMLQRRGVYKSMADKAKQENNDSKARRIGRIIKQYEDTIRKQKLGKPIDLSELPSLPAFLPFPSQSGGQAAPSVAQVAAPTAPPAAAPVVSAAAGASAPSARTAGQVPQPTASRPPAPTRQMSAKENMYQRNIVILKDRIAQFRKLALEAKRRGDIYEAKRLLKIAKEIEPMLSAAEGGLPVNLDSIPKVPRKEPEAVSPPTSPEPDGDYEMVGDGSAQEVYARLISTLNKQIEICEANAKVYGKLGNIKSAKRFQEFQDSCQQDIDLLISKQSRGEAIPRHHYEQRTLPSVRVCPDVKENEAEIIIVQGLQLHCPNEKDSKDVDTYIKAEFPYPSDDPPTHKTGWAKGADNPQYNLSYMVEINRSSRAFNSAVKRKALKLEIIYSKGLLRGHKTLGTASLKLAELENKCELHESIPLMDGRREIGGKIEVKIRLHHPLSGLKEDFVKEKWLIIDSIHKKTKVSSPPAAASKKASSSSSSASGSSSGSGQRTSATDSIEILKWEIGTLKKKIADIQARKQQVPNEFVMSYRTLQERLQKLQIFLKEGGSQARNAYLGRLQALSPNLLAQAKETLQAGHKEKASMFMTRKKLVDAEISSLSRR